MHIPPTRGSRARPHILDPAIRADVQRRLVGWCLPERVQPLSGQRRVPGIQAVRAQVQRFPQRPVELLSGYATERPERAPELDEVRRTVGLVLVEKIASGSVALQRQVQVVPDAWR